MQRKLLKDLIAWKNKINKKPLVISGIRGVGKTFLADDFIHSAFSANIYFNFELDNTAASLFSSDITKTLNNISSYYDTEIDYENTAIVLDEFVSDNVMDFITEYSKHVKSFASSADKTNLIKLNIICLISDCNLMGYFYKNKPVDLLIDNTAYFQHIILYPFDFDEFLQAIGKDWYCETISEHFSTNKPVPDIVHEELLNYFNLYIYIGGMPYAINEYLMTNSLTNISQCHHQILNNNLMDLYERVDYGEFIKTSAVYNTIPAQLSKPNHKFQYTLIRKGATCNIYKHSINNICSIGYAKKCCKSDMESSFKLYMCDVGLLNSLNKANNNDEFNKSLIENYVFENLIANGNDVTFWESKSQAKIDFVTKKNDHIYAIEVKNSQDTRSKNYSIFKEAVSENDGLIKVSTRNFSYNKGIKYIPLYAVSCI